MVDDPNDGGAPRGPAWSAALGTTVGPVLLTIGLGNLLRGGASLIVGSVFLVGGVVATVLSLRHQRSTARSTGTVPPTLGRHLLVLGLTIVIGALVYYGLLTLMDRS